MEFPPTGQMQAEKYRSAGSPDVTAQEAEDAWVGPCTPTENVLAPLWCEMLDLKKVGARDNFLELGENSLLGVRVIGRINETLDVRLSIVDRLRAPTIEALAASVERNCQAGDRGAQVISLQTAMERGHSRVERLG